MATGPGDEPAAAGRDRLRAGHADREQVIEALKAAFVQGRLTRDELGARVGRALAARTYADLAALTADIPPGPSAARPARRPARARRRPLARAAAGSGGCLVIAFAAVWVGGHLDNPLGPSPYKSLIPLCLVMALTAVFTALFILGNGVAASIEQRRSRRQLPPRPGPGGHTLDGERRSGPGRDPGPPGPRTGQNRADLSARWSRQHRQHVPSRAARAPRGVRPAPGGV